MTLSELKAAGERANQIEHALRALAESEERLTLINKHGDAGKTWKARLVLRVKDWNRGIDELSIEVALPFGVIQQQAVYAVEAARREIIKLGGEIPALKKVPT